MTFRASRARRAEQYFWFEGRELERVIRQLDSAEKPRLRVYPGLTEDGQEELFLQVYNGEEACGGEENSSHVCPPSCP